MTCFNVIAAPVYSGRDNIISLLIKADGDILADLSGVTRVTVDMDGGVTVLDSDIVGSSVIWWTDSTTYRGETVDLLRLQLGDQGITAGTYDDVAIIVYDSTYTNGLQVENDIRITVS